MSDTIPINPRAPETIEKPTGATHTFQTRRFRAFFLEFEDLHFNHDSSVLIADHRDTAHPDDDDSTGAQADHEHEHITALAVIAAVYRQVQQHPEQKLLLTGHTDRSGQDAYNLRLSRRRARNILHLLRGEKEAWARHNEPTRNHEVEDYQQLLKWMFEEHGWDTDPGEITDSLNKETRDAVERFQKRYNIEFNQSISEDGIVGKQTWGAFFDIYMEELQSILDVDEAGLASMQQSLNFLSSSIEFVGCGENWPITAQNRSRTDRRVEVYFFDPGEEPTLPLPCHPSESRCIKDLCEIRDSAIYELIPIPVTPILPPRFRLRVHLVLVWKDPSGADHPFPKDLTAKISFGDGSDDQEVQIGENGVLDFIVDKRKGSFTFGFVHAEASYFITAPEASSSSDNERLVTRPEVAALVRDGSRAFLLPPSWNLDNGDWEVDTTKATTYAQPNFENLDTLEEIGTHDDPCRVELKPHWQYMKFLYFDRKLKKKLSVVPLMVEGFADRDAASGDPDTQSNWTTPEEACQCLPWIRRKADDGSALEDPGEKVLVQFRTKDNTFIDSTAGEASGGGRKLVSKDAGAAGNDPGLNGGENSSTDFRLANPERLAFYDLPPLWKSRNYFAKLSGETPGRFETLAGKDTTDAAPLLFSLDDMVLTKENLDPVTWVPKDDRCAIFSNTFSKKDNSGSDDPNLSPMGLYKPDSGNQRSYLSQIPQHEKTENYIADYPDWTRLVAAQGNLFDVFDRRTTSGKVIGARAATRWVDSASIKKPGNVLSPRPGASITDFCIVHPFYEQRHHNHTDPEDDDTRGIGRYDMTLLRCCDDDGGTEVAINLHYFRFNFSFDFTPTEKEKKQGREASGLTGAAARKFEEDCCTNIADRWNGNDKGFNIHPVQLLPTDPAAHKLQVRPLWFVQALPKDVSHFAIRVFKDIRASMNSRNGTGKLELGEQRASPGPPANKRKKGQFVAAHECGHGNSLGDEYIERSRSASYFFKGIISFSGGSPFGIDRNAMMNGNINIRPRYYWHAAEWLRHLLGFDFEVKRRSDNYRLPHHPQAPRFSHINWWMKRDFGAERGERGNFDIFFYPLGSESFFSKNLLKKGACDGLIIVVVKLRIKLHTNRFKPIQAILKDVVLGIKGAFNKKWAASGSVSGFAFNRAMLYFDPRLVVTTYPDHPSDKKHRDKYNKAMGISDEDEYEDAIDDRIIPRGGGIHFDIDIRSSGTDRWDDSFFGDLVGDKNDLILHSSPSATRGARIVPFFANMLGIDDGSHNTAAAFEPIVHKVVPGASVFSL